MRPVLRRALPVPHLVPLCLGAAQPRRETLRGAKAWALPRLQGGSALGWARAYRGSSLSAGGGWAWFSPWVTLWGPGTASSRAEHLPCFTEPQFLVPPAAASPHMQCFPRSSEASTSLSCCLLSLMVENPQVNTITLVVTTWEIFSWLNFFSSVSEVFRDSWEESCIFLIPCLMMWQPRLSSQSRCFQQQCKNN